MLIEDEYGSLADEALRGLDVMPPVAQLGSTGVEASVPSAREHRPPRHVDDDDPLLIIFTSGSEAAPKGVVLTHANCFWNNLALAQALQLTSDDVVLAMLPQFHVAAWNCQPLLAWWVGATVVLERSFQPARALQLLQERRVTTMMGVPTQYPLLAADRAWASTDVSSLRIALVGGATMPSALPAAWAARGVTLTQGYGLTEAAPNVLRLPPDEASANVGAVGRPYPHVDVASPTPTPACRSRVRRPASSGCAARASSPGTSAIPRPPSGRDGGEWLRTGDLVHRDADGVYRIVDRIKDIFISGGENVAPAEVEQALRLHPLIEAAAVVGVPDRVWGERGVAFVVPSPAAAIGRRGARARAVRARRVQGARSRRLRR